jgi:hypothetical protein
VPEADAVLYSAALFSKKFACVAAFSMSSSQGGDGRGFATGPARSYRRVNQAHQQGAGP